MQEMLDSELWLYIENRVSEQYPAIHIDIKSS